MALQDASQPAAARLGAAKAVLDLGLKIREVADIEVRLRELEQRIEQRREEESRGGRAGANEPRR